MANLTFRNSKIIYYGPHACDNCGAVVCKMGADFGGNAFTYPDGPIYPNTEWHPHVCDPVRVRQMTSVLPVTTGSATVSGPCTEMPGINYPPVR